MRCERVAPQSGSKPQTAPRFYAFGDPKPSLDVPPQTLAAASGRSLPRRAAGMVLRPKDTQVQGVGKLFSDKELRDTADRMHLTPSVHPPSIPTSEPSSDQP